MRATGVIFDFNGTMLYDTQLQYQSWKQVLREQRGLELRREDFLQYANGRTSRAILLHFVGGCLTEPEQNRLLGQKRAVYRRLCLESPEAFRLADGLPGMLDMLRERSVPFTIASSSHPESMDFYFRHLRLDQWFDRAAVVCNENNLPSKPAPDIYLLAAQKIGVSPAGCMVLEDAIAGARSARSAGIGQIVLIDPDRSGAFWVDDLVDYVVHTYDEVKELLLLQL